MSAAQISAARLNDLQHAQGCLSIHRAGVAFLNAFKRVLKRFKQTRKGVQAMAVKARRISPQKIALIHVAVHKLGMGEAEYRVLLMGAAGVSSSRELSEAGFDAVMKRFELLGFAHVKVRTGKVHAPTYGDRSGMASQAQLLAIREMWHAWHGGEEAEAARALRRWLERCYQVTDLRFCDVTVAQKAIEGLKAMNRRKQRAAVKDARHD